MFLISELQASVVEFNELQIIALQCASLNITINGAMIPPVVTFLAGNVSQKATHPPVCVVSTSRSSRQLSQWWQWNYWPNIKETEYDKDNRFRSRSWSSHSLCRSSIFFDAAGGADDVLSFDLKQRCRQIKRSWVYSPFHTSDLNCLPLGWNAACIETLNKNNVLDLQSTFDLDVRCSLVLNEFQSIRSRVCFITLIIKVQVTFEHWYSGQFCHFKESIESGLKFALLLSKSNSVGSHADQVSNADEDSLQGAQTVVGIDDVSIDRCLINAKILASNKAVARQWVSRISIHWGNILPKFFK